MNMANAELTDLGRMLLEEEPKYEPKGRTARFEEKQKDLIMYDAVRRFEDRVLYLK